MRILIIGKADNPFTYFLYKWLKIKKKYKIDVLNVSDKVSEEIDGKVKQIFPKKHIEKGGVLNKIKTIYYLRRELKKINNNYYDVILLHYVFPWYSMLSSLIKHKTKNLIPVFWGSDLTRLDKKRENKLKKLIKVSDNVILGSPSLLDKITSHYPDYKSKFRMCYFGCEPIETLKKMQENKISNIQSKDRYNIKKDKVTIALGYNGGEAQQHEKMLLSLMNSKLLEKHKDDIHLFLPITYGLKKEYYKKITNLIEKLNIDNTVFTKFMNEKESANLRNATDIFVNVQIADSFNGTLRESFYAGSVIINGSWLPYKKLKEYGLYYHEIEEIDVLDKKIDEILNNFKEEKNKSLINKGLIYDITSWSKTITSWINVIENN